MNRISTRPSTSFRARIAVTALAAVTSALLGIHAASAQTTPAAAPAAAAPAGDVARGKSAFMRFGCYECHGTVGQGNYTTAPKLAPNPRPYAGLLAYIRRPSGNMPAFSATILPDKDVADIYAYLSSIKPGKSAAELPLLSGTTLKPK
jgi:ubiquinol-cytochrome c reductase cytochrome c subunit